MDRMVVKRYLIGSWLICLVAWFAVQARASFDRDLIQETRSGVVPVTEELLTREGEPGPASPTFKLGDTSEFLVEEPYGSAEEEEDKPVVEETKRHWWDDWFSWNEDDSKAKKSVTNSD